MSKICPHCGVEVDDSATRCYNCQKWLVEQNAIIDDSKPQDFLSTVLFAWFLGCFGIHRFWTGHTAIGIAQLLTLGGCGIWTYIDLILICFNKFKDAQNRELRDYNKPNARTHLKCFHLARRGLEGYSADFARLLAGAVVCASSDTEIQHIPA